MRGDAAAGEGGIGEVAFALHVIALDLDLKLELVKFAVVFQLAQGAFGFADAGTWKRWVIEVALLVTLLVTLHLVRLLLFERLQLVVEAFEARPSVALLREGRRSKGAQKR
jgi:hypothetical protein